MNAPPNLTTERLMLRPFTLSDAERVAQIAGKKEVADTTLNIPHPYPEGEAEKWIKELPAKYEAGKRIEYAIVPKEIQEVIGSVRLDISKRFNHAALGFWIDPEEWNKGYTTEASRELIKYGFEERKLHRIYAEHIPRNPASGKVMQKIGMQKEAELRQHIKKWNVYENLIMYGILKEEWSINRDQEMEQMNVSSP